MARAGSERQNRGLVMLRGGLLAVLLIFIIPTAHAVAPMVVTGAWHTLALKSDSTVWAWGQNDTCGALGLGDTVTRLSPVQVPISGVVAIAASQSHSLALKTDGTLWAWGCNNSGQLGLGDTVHRFSPVKVPISGVAAMVAGGEHTLALKSDGSLWAWGLNYMGQLGLGDTVDRYTPEQVPISGVVVVAGYWHTLALKSDGSLWAWGDNSNAKLGIGEPVWNGDYRCPLLDKYEVDKRCSPVRVPISRVVAMAAGSSHTLALKSNGTVWGWGMSDGLGLGEGVYSYYPAQLPISGVRSVVAGADQSFALKNDGTFWAWGWNAFGVLGLGDTVTRYSPAQVSISGVVQMSSAGPISSHTLALKNDGTVWGWGWNGEPYNSGGGALGLGDRLERHSPTQIPNFNLGSGGHPIYPDVCSINPDQLVKNRLVLVVHGWNSNSEDWPTLMANTIRDRLRNEPGVKWHICAYDWRDGAGYGCDSDLNPLPGCFSPWDAYINALTIGQALGEKLATLNLDHIHFIGHSAGSQLVETAATWVWVRAQLNGIQRPTIHSTFLDAFDPRREGSTYGQYADFADHYVDTRRTGTSDLDDTDLVLPYAYNVDVTALDPCSTDFVGIHAHQWPYQWYQATISTPLANNYGLSHGFVFALESGRTSLPSLAQGSITHLDPRYPWAPIHHSDFNCDGRDDLAGVNSASQIYYSTNRSTWTRIPGALTRLVVGDFDSNGRADLAGLNSAGSIYYSTNLKSWTRIPGALVRLVAADFDGDGKKDDLAGLNSAGHIYYTTNRSTWTRIPGALTRLVVGDFNGDGRDDLAGLNSAGAIYYTTNRSTWTRIPGALTRLVAGDFNGDGRADLAGLNSAGHIYYTTNKTSWTRIPGVLTRLVSGDFNNDGKDDLAGLNSAGSIYYTTNRSTWTGIPGILARLVSGDFNGDGRDDLAGVNSAGSVYYSTSLSTWTPIPGRLSRLAGDTD